MIGLFIPAYNLFGFEDPIARSPYNILAWVFIVVSIMTVIRYNVVNIFVTVPAPRESLSPDGPDDPDKHPSITKKLLVISMVLLVITIIAVWLWKNFITSRVELRLDNDYEKTGLAALNDTKQKWDKCIIFDSPMSRGDGLHRSSSDVYIAERIPSRTELMPSPSESKTRPPCYKLKIKEYKSGADDWYDGVFQTYTKAVNISTIWLEEDIIMPFAKWKVIQVSRSSHKENHQQQLEVLEENIQEKLEVPAYARWRATCAFDSQSKEWEIDFESDDGNGKGKEAFGFSRHEFEASATVKRVKGYKNKVIAKTRLNAYEYTLKWDGTIHIPDGVGGSLRPAEGDPRRTYDVPGDKMVLSFRCKPVTQSKQ
jgi:hypothetical protein